MNLPVFLSMAWPHVKLVIVAAGLSALLFWSTARVRSLHMLLELVWRVLFGRRHAESSRMRAFYQQRAALMHFRWVSNIPVRTLREARSLVAWCQTNDEEVADVRACGDYFDRSKPGLRVAAKGVTRAEARAQKRRILPGAAVQITLVLAAFALCLGLVWTAVYGSISGVIVSVKGGSGIQLVLYPDHFSPLQQLSVSISTAQCQDANALARSLRLPLSEVRTACGWLVNPDRATYVAKGVAGQRLALAFLGLGLAWLAYALLAWLRAIFAAQNMRQRLDARAASSTLAVEKA